MPVTHEAQNSASAEPFSTSLPGFNVTPVGTNRFMLIGARYQQDVGATTITVDGAAATKIAHVTNGSNLTIELWYFNNPAASSLAIAGTVAVSANGRAMGAACFAGVDIIDFPLGTHATNNGSSTSASVAVTGGTASGLCYAIAGMRFPAAAITAGDTVSWEVDDAVNDIYAGTSYLPGASGTLDWTLVSADWQMIGVAVREATAGGGALPFSTTSVARRMR